MKKFSLMTVLLAFSLIQTPSFSGPQEKEVMNELSKIYLPRLKAEFQDLTPREQRAWLKKLTSYMRAKPPTGVSQGIEPTTTIALGAAAMAGLQVVQNCDDRYCVADVHGVGEDVGQALHEAGQWVNMDGWSFW